MNAFSDFIDRYFAFAGALAVLVLLVSHFSQVTQGLGSLTQSTGQFVSAFK